MEAKEIQVSMRIGIQLLTRKAEFEEQLKQFKELKIQFKTLKSQYLLADQCFFPTVT